MDIYTYYVYTYIQIVISYLYAASLSWQGQDLHIITYSSLFTHPILFFLDANLSLPPIYSFVCPP